MTVSHVMSWGWYDGESHGIGVWYVGESRDVGRLV